MSILYREDYKDLPIPQLQKLFVSVGWDNGDATSEMIRNYNKPFINSTLIISAWDNQRLVGVYERMGFQASNEVILTIPSIYVEEGRQ